MEAPLGCVHNTIARTSQGSVKKGQIETLRVECANGLSTKQYEDDRATRGEDALRALLS